MISPRFAPAACVLVLLALVPTWIHGYAGAVNEDGLTAAAISFVLGAHRGTSTDRNADWGMRRFESGDWIERSYTDGRDSVRLTVVRSYDPKRLYHHPELAVAYGTSFGPATIERLPVRPDLPVHVLRSTAGPDTVALYALRYGDEFVSDPIRFQIRTAGELLFTPRKAMTLFFTTESDVPEGVDLEKLDSVQVLVSAIDAFLAQSPTQAAPR